MEEANNPSKPKSEMGTPEGFGKGVNDYYNQFVTVADAKAGALLGANFFLIGGLVGLKTDCTSIVFFLASGAFSLLSIAFCCTTLYPRLPKSKRGVIFWENIYSYGSMGEFLNDVSKLDKKTIELEYAKQNWHVSKVLHRKNRSVRWAILAFSIALLLLVITYLLRSN